MVGHLAMLARMAVPMEPTRWTVRLAWGLCLLSLACIAVTIGLAIVNRASIQTPDDAGVLETVLPLSFAILGGLVASRLPGNALGWVFLAIALCSAIPGPANQYTRYALMTNPGAPFTPWIPWIGDLAATLVYPAGLASLAFLLTPNGRFLSRRWRAVAWAGAVVTANVMLVTMAEPEVGWPTVPNPTYVPGIGDLGTRLYGSVVFLSGLAVLAASGASVLIRLRRSTGDERLQLRWVAYAAVFAIAANVIVSVATILLVGPDDTAFPWFVTIIGTVGFGVVLPLAFGIAILRYRLYDLDYFLNRTVVYGAVTVILVGLFLALYLAAQSVMQTVFDQRSDLIAAALGAGAALAFGPMRRVLQPVVDRLLPARSRLTLLFTDIVESTQAIVDLGDEQWRDVLVALPNHGPARAGEESRSRGEHRGRCLLRGVRPAAERRAMRARHARRGARAGPAGAHRAAFRRGRDARRAGDRAGGPCRRPRDGHGGGGSGRDLRRSGGGTRRRGSHPRRRPSGAARRARGVAAVSGGLGDHWTMLGG